MSPRIDCPGVVPFCPPIIGGGGIGFDGATSAPRFNEVVPAGQQVEMARITLSSIPNQIFLVNGVLAGIQDTGDASSLAQASLVMVAIVRNSAGVLSLGLFADLGISTALDIAIAFDGNDVVFSADNVSADDRLYSFEVEALGFPLPFPFDP